MDSRNSPLIQLIRDTVQRQGPMTFEWFMEQALYHPELGYYGSGRCVIGRRGDYITNVSVGALFGRLLAAQFSEMWESLDRPDDFVIVEQGAHHGEFARDVLEALRERKPELFAVVRYSIIEPFPVLHQIQREALSHFGDKLTWKRSLADLEPFCGVHFSNELLDAMPVRLISRSEIGWQERRVTEIADEFHFVATPIADVDLSCHLETIPLPTNPPYETEANLAALKWVEMVAQKLVRGYVLTVDYGYSRDDYYAPERSSGTLRCYSDHRIVPSPFDVIGDADVTAHVDWTSIAARAHRHGLSLVGFVDQYHFMTGVVAGRKWEQFDAANDAKARRALQTLLHPELLGRTFQFLALTKGVATGSQLSGLQFAGNPNTALGL